MLIILKCDALKRVKFETKDFPMLMSSILSPDIMRYLYRYIYIIA